MEEVVKVRKDLNDIVSNIEFKRIDERYSSRDVAIVTFYNGSKVEFRDRDGLYDLFSEYRNLGYKDFIKSKVLFEDVINGAQDVSSDDIDSSFNTYVCVLFELQDGSKYRLFPRQKFTDRRRIDLLYKTYKAKNTTKPTNQVKTN